MPPISALAAHGALRMLPFSGTRGAVVARAAAEAPAEERAERGVALEAQARGDRAHRSRIRRQPPARLVESQARDVGVGRQAERLAEQAQETVARQAGHARQLAQRQAPL